LPGRPADAISCQPSPSSARATKLEPPSATMSRYSVGLAFAIHAADHRHTGIAPRGRDAGPISIPRCAVGVAFSLIGQAIANDDTIIASIAVRISRTLARR
jgi:hypothetical protein